MSLPPVKTGTVKDSFLIKGRGIPVFFQHHENGLPSGTRLISQKTGLEWILKNRMTFDFPGHRIFENELTLTSLTTYISLAKREEFLLRVADEERNHIFHYELKEAEHGQKPEKGELLSIKFPMEKNHF